MSLYIHSQNTRILPISLADVREAVLKGITRDKLHLHFGVERGELETTLTESIKHRDTYHNAVAERNSIQSMRSEEPERVETLKRERIIAEKIRACKEAGAKIPYLMRACRPVMSEALFDAALSLCESDGFAVRREVALVTFYFAPEFAPPADAHLYLGYKAGVGTVVEIVSASRQLQAA